MILYEGQSINEIKTYGKARKTFKRGSTIRRNTKPKPKSGQVHCPRNEVKFIKKVTSKSANLKNNRQKY